MLVPFSRPYYHWGNLAHNKDVESFDLETECWRTEDSFPFTPAGGSTNVQYGRGFLSIGGYTNDKRANTIFRVT